MEFQLKFVLHFNKQQEQKRNIYTKRTFDFEKF